MRTLEDMVRAEIVHNCSQLVSTLASASGMSQSAIDADPDAWELFNAAVELSMPLLDYEEAAREAGWKEVGRGGETRWISAGGRLRLSAEEACSRDAIEPHEREVYEHWIVTDWLADKLEAKGEKVDKDFAGLCVWARTTTGQAIVLDSVMEAIHRECASDYLLTIYGDRDFARDRGTELRFTTPEGEALLKLGEGEDVARVLRAAEMAGWKPA